MAVKLKNRATTLLSSTITAESTALAVTAGTGSRFPSLASGEWFPLVVVDSAGNEEIMRATARSGDTITVTRGEEGTTARGFNAGAAVDLRITVAALDDIIAALEADTEAQVAALNNTLSAAIAAITPKPGTVRLVLYTTADAGWLMCNDGTIGNAGSGATYANANAAALFEVAWNISAAYVPIYTSTGAASARGATAAADFAALKRIGLTRMLGRVLAIAGAGAGLGDTLDLGSYFGARTHTIAQANLPAVNFAVSGITLNNPPHGHGVNDPGHGHGVNDPGHGHGISDPGHGHGYTAASGLGQVQGGTGAFVPSSNPETTSPAFTGISLNGSGTGISINGSGTGISIQQATTAVSVATQGSAASGGSGTAINHSSPTAVLNAMVKL